MLDLSTSALDLPGASNELDSVVTPSYRLISANACFYDSDVYMSAIGRKVYCTGRLTRHGLQSRRSPRFILACEVAGELVAGAEGDDGEERPDQGEGVVDVPAAEDYAEVLCRPGEEHLEGD